MKCSSEERVTVEPSKIKLAPHEVSKPIEVRVRLTRPPKPGVKSVQMKETLFIKSDFFD